MELFKDWAFSVCCAAVIGGIFNMMLLEGSLQKTFKIVLCVFFLCVVAAPLFKIDFSGFEIISENIYDSEIIYGKNDFTENSLEFMESEIKTSALKILEEEGISAKDISVKINISENGSIDIIKFALTLDNAENTESIVEKIYRKIGIMPEITFSGDKE